MIFALSIVRLPIGKLSGDDRQFIDAPVARALSRTAVAYDAGSDRSARTAAPSSAKVSVSPSLS